MVTTAELFWSKLRSEYKKEGAPTTNEPNLPQSIQLLSSKDSKAAQVLYAGVREYVREQAVELSKIDTMTPKAAAALLVSMVTEHIKILNSLSKVETEITKTEAVDFTPDPHNTRFFNLLDWFTDLTQSEQQFLNIMTDSPRNAHHSKPHKGYDGYRSPDVEMKPEPRLALIMLCSPIGPGKFAFETSGNRNDYERVLVPSGVYEEVIKQVTKKYSERFEATGVLSYNYGPEREVTVNEFSGYQLSKTSIDSLSQTLRDEKNPNDPNSLLNLVLDRLISLKNEKTESAATQILEAVLSKTLENPQYQKQAAPTLITHWNLFQESSDNSRSTSKYFDLFFCTGKTTFNLVFEDFLKTLTDTDENTLKNKPNILFLVNLFNKTNRYADSNPPDFLFPTSLTSKEITVIAKLYNEAVRADFNSAYCNKDDTDLIQKLDWYLESLSINEAIKLIKDLREIWPALNVKPLIEQLSGCKRVDILTSACLKDNELRKTLLSEFDNAIQNLASLNLSSDTPIPSSVFNSDLAIFSILSIEDLSLWKPEQLTKIRGALVTIETAARAYDDDDDSLIKTVAFQINRIDRFTASRLITNPLSDQDN